MDDMSDRVMFLIEELGYSKSSFSKAIGKSREVIEGIVGKRRNNPSASTLAEIMLAFPEINADWLITGKGNPFKVDLQKVNIEEFREKFETEYINQYRWNSDDVVTIARQEEEIKSLKAIVEEKEKQLEEKEKTNSALERIVNLLDKSKK